MKVIVKMSDRLSFEAEASNQRELFEKIAEIDKASEVFGINQCGVCKNRNIKFNVRVAQPTTGKNKGKTFFYPELVCANMKCRAKLCIGEHQGGAKTIYPKRKDEEGNFMSNDGWVKYEKPEDENKDN